MPKIKTRCPQCGQKYNIPAEHLGTEIECPQCLAGFLVQELKEAPPVPAPTPKPILTPIEDDEPVHSMPAEKPQEKKDSSGQEKAKVYWDKIKQLKHNPALLGALCCLIIAAGINFFSNFLFLLWGPLYLVVFILGIVAIVQQRVGKGIGFIIASILFPAFICTANILIVPMAMMGLSTKIAHAEKEARLAELTERDLLTPSSQETSRKSVSLRSGSVSSPVAEKPSIDQHRQEMINLAKSISRPSEKYILNMLQQVALVEKTKAVKNNSQDYCRIEIREKQLNQYIKNDINQFQKEIELGLLTQVGQSVRPTARTRQVNGTYEYSYVPDRVVRILPPSYDQKADAIDCVVTYNVSLQGIPKYVLDNAHVLNRWAKWRQGSFNIYDLKLENSKSITFFWSQSRREWMLKYDGAIYDYQPDFKFEATDNEITFAPEVIDPAPQVAAVPVAQSRHPVKTLQSPTTPGVIVVPSSPDQPIQMLQNGKRSLADNLVVRNVFRSRVMLQRVRGSNRNDCKILLDIVDESGFKKEVKQLNSVITVGNQGYKIVDCMPKEETVREGKMNIINDLSQIVLQKLNSSESVVVTTKKPTFFSPPKARLQDVSTGHHYTLAVGETFTIGDTKTGKEEYKVLSIDSRFNLVQLMNMKDNSIVEVSQIKRFELGSNMPTSPPPQIYHQPWERLELRDAFTYSKKYTINLEKVVVISSNKYQWRARLKFTADNGKVLNRSLRIDDDLTIGGDTYRIVDIYVPEYIVNKPRPSQISLVNAFNNKPNLEIFIELLYKTTGEKQKIYENQTIRVGDYKVFLTDKETKEKFDLSPGDKFSINHKGETYQYRIAEVKGESVYVSPNVSSHEYYAIIEDLKSGKKIPLRKPQQILRF
ncbi:MAG: hypothetical protein JXR78_10280 [Victivallales bacterium]|nr:hypothetical protein [Victivallales bacterium]